MQVTLIKNKLAHAEMLDFYTDLLLVIVQIMWWKMRTWYWHLNFEQVTEKADFQKDLSLDSLDRVELVMAIEQEFSVEIPEEKADQLKCCADVTEYIISAADHKIAEDSWSQLETYLSPFFFVLFKNIRELTVNFSWILVSS